MSVVQEPLVLHDAVAQARSAFITSVVPAVEQFVDNELSANALQQIWLAYYESAVTAVDNTLKPLIHQRFGDDPDALAPAPFVAEPIDELAYYPLSISHHNLHRLIEVLADELGDETCDRSAAPQRILDLCVVIDELTAVFTRLSPTSH